MRERKGDWRDVLSAYTLALDAKKLYMGFVATLGTVLVMLFSAMLYGVLVAEGSVANMGDLAAQNHIFQDWLQGDIGALTAFISVLNPFAGGLAHFGTSLLFYVLLLAVWSFMGGVISRIAALEYGRDELPTLSDGVDMVRKKYAAYFFAPLSPLIGVVIFSLLNSLGGLIGSIPYVGPILMIVGVVPWFISTVIVVFIAVLGVVSYCMMYPAISIGGKDAFEGWSSAYSYVLWGVNRFVGYSVLAALIGIVSTVAAWALCEFFIYALLQSLHYGFLGGSWVPYVAFGGPFYNTKLLMPEGSALLKVSGVWMLVALLCVRTLPVAYLFSYFFSSGTIICFLMRKHVDRIEIDEVYEEEEEEEFGEMPEEPEAPGTGFQEEQQAEGEEEGGEGEQEEAPEEAVAEEEEEEEEEQQQSEESGPEEAPEEKTEEEPGEQPFQEEEDKGSEEEEENTG